MGYVSLQEGIHCEPGFFGFFGNPHYIRHLASPPTDITPTFVGPSWPSCPSHGKRRRLVVGESPAEAVVDDLGKAEICGSSLDDELRLMNFLYMAW